MSEWILEGEDLQYAYEDGTQALRGLSFAVRRGKSLPSWVRTGRENPPCFPL